MKKLMETLDVFYIKMMLHLAEDSVILVLISACLHTLLIPSHTHESTVAAVRDLSQINSPSSFLNQI